MRRHVHNILAALLCVCLLVSYTPLPASGAEASVGEPGSFVEGQASTTVSVMTVGLSIAGKTDDITTSVADIMKDAALPNSERTYLLKVVLSGANPADCSFTWTRGVVAADGTVQPDPAFSDTHADHALVDDAQAGLLQTGTTYRYTVDVSDSSTGQSASASIDVTISDDYLDRTLAHASGVAVTGPILRELTDADLTVETVDPESPLYAILQEAAQGMELRATWQVTLPAGSGGKKPLSGPVHVSLPAEVEDGAKVSVIMLGADGVPAVVDDEARDGFVTVEAAGLGAFAVAVPVARTFTVTATCGEGGSVSPDGSKEYAEDATPLYTFLPNTGFVLDAVTVDGQAVKPEGNTYRFAPLSASHDLHATFKKVEPAEEEHTVTARVSGGHGLVSIDGADPHVEQSTVVRHGQRAVVSFAPDEGYVIDKVTVRVGDAEPVRVAATGDSYILSAVEADTVVEVAYRAGSTPPVLTHVVTASVADGRGSLSPERATVAYGGWVTFTFVPDDGWRIASVTANGEDVTPRVAGGALLLENIVADTEVLVSFEELADADAEKFVQVSASTGPGGSISPAGEVTLPKGGSQTFYFLPDAGKRVSSVMVDGKRLSFSGSSYTLFGIDADTSILVEFADVSADEPARPNPVTHTVTASASSGGRVSPAGATEVVDGGALLFALVPQEGFVVDAVTVDGVEVQRGGTSFRLTDVRADATMEVSYRRNAEPDGPLISMDVKVEAQAESGEGGSVSPSGTISLARGATQTFYVYPDEGYDLDRVTVNERDVSAQPAGVVSLARARTIGAHGAYRFSVLGVEDEVKVSVFFKKLGDGEPAPQPVRTHAVNVAATEGGTVSPLGESRVPEGGSITLAVKSDEGFQLAALMVNGEDEAGQVKTGALELSGIAEDTDVMATFERVPSEPEAPSFSVVHASTSAGGSMYPAGDVRVPTGGSQTFAFVPDEGFVLDRVTVDGREVVPIDGAYTMFDVAADARIHAEFRARTAEDPEPVLPELRTVRVQAEPGGTVEPSGDVRVAVGSSATFSLTPDEGFRLDRVEVDGEDATGQVAEGVLVLDNVVEDRVLAVSFARIGSDEPDPPAPPAATYTVTARVEGGHGSVSPAGAVTVAEGADQSFCFLPDAGYAVGAVWVDGVRLTWSPHSWTFPNVRANHELAVSFKPAPVPAPGPDAQPSSILTRTGDAPWTLAFSLVAVTALGVVLAARGHGRRAGAAARKTEGR